jgi:2-polyprenyl-6-methoxyphenol hydroxylase-like FAD-dependent oxidoreductase
MERVPAEPQAAGRYDVLVLGAGPAGVAAARGLVALGHGVALIGAPRPYAALEGLSERALVALESAGCGEARARVGPEVRRVATWDGARSEANRERLVDRQVFDQGLWLDARAAGIAAIAARVKAVEAHPEGWRVTARGEDGQAVTLEAGFLVEARGRAAPAGRGREGLGGPATTALVRRWHLAPGGAAMTAVAAFRDGWCWYVTLGEGSALLQVFVSGETGALPSRRDLAPFYQNLVGQIPEAGAWLAGATPDGPVEARNAAPRLAGTLLGPRFARVGDAAFAADPLSGHGVFQALALGLALPAVVNTLIRRPADRALAEAFYRERVEDGFLRMARTGRDFYRQETRWPGRDFWRNRATWPDAEPAHAAPGSAPPRVAARPVSEDGYIRARPVIVTPDYPRGIWRVAEVPLVPLMAFMAETGAASPADMAAGFGARAGHPPGAVETALSWLAQCGLLTRDGARIALHPTAGAKLLESQDGGAAER